VIRIQALPAFTDNYIWLLQDSTRQRCAAVDPGDAAPVLQWLEQHPGWQLEDILVTHHHYDHVNGVLALKQACGARVCGPAGENIPGLDLALHDGDRLEVLGRSLQVLHVPGHTLGHIAYYQAEGAWLLSGDTLFAGGCGRLFEGTPAQMHASLQRLAALPGDTALYCTHEYTLANLRFAAAVEPHNPAVARRLEQVAALREQGLCSLPSSIAEERSSNPFLRCSEPAVIASVSTAQDAQAPDAEQVFARLRQWKNDF
jgi:hydroxyacylglutathione hydrolase